MFTLLRIRVILSFKYSINQTIELHKLLNDPDNVIRKLKKGLNVAT